MINQKLIVVIMNSYHIDLIKQDNFLQKLNL
jgi:hypothetical protein